VLRELASGAWDLAAFGTEDLGQAHAIVGRSADQSIGLAEASIVILAARYQTRTVVTPRSQALRRGSGGRRRQLRDLAVASNERGRRVGWACASRRPEVLLST